MLEYLKNRILDELDDSIDYMKKALECKSNGDGDCYIFILLSDEEVKHANALANVFNRTKKSSNADESDISEMQSEILEGYSEKMQKLESMKKVYFSV